MTEQAFQVGNIVHVIGFNAATSTGEVVETDANECCRTYTVHFDDGETTEFAENELRLANDLELYVYLRGHTDDFIADVLKQQAGTQLTVRTFHPAFPVPQFFAGMCVQHDEYGLGVVVSRHDEDNVPYYTVAFHHEGDRESVPVPCDGFELEMAGYEEIERYCIDMGLDEKARTAMNELYDTGLPAPDCEEDEENGTGEY